MAPIASMIYENVKIVHQAVMYAHSLIVNLQKEKEEPSGCID